MTPPATDSNDSFQRDAGRGAILVAGASGYVGGRLVPELLALGRPVRCMSRSRSSLERASWSERVELVEADLEEPATLPPAVSGAEVIVYLVHSLDAEDFEERELRAAEHAARAAAEHGVQHIVYLSGLGVDGERLSPHLRSRHAVGRALASTGVPVTEVRAAVILGAGSASFEMLRSLVEVLPVMIAPRWVTATHVQPIAIADVLTYLVAAVRDEPPGAHRVVEIGGPDVLTYRDLMDCYAEAAGLRRRWVVPVPVVTPALSSHWVNLVTPLPRRLARSLIESLVNDVVVTDRSAEQLSAHRPLRAVDAIGLALSQVADLDIPTRWSGVTPRQRAGRPQPWDPDWSGGTVLEDVQRTVTDVAPADIQRVVRGIGGRRGWFGFGFLWSVRGLVDKATGGVGLRRGRRHPDQIEVGEALDFWRVDAVDDDLFRLRAEMRLPGEAWLEWSTCVDDEGRSVVEQRARFVPRGLPGRLYWLVVLPFHRALFPTMLRRIVAAAGAARSGASQPTDRIRSATG